MTARYRLTPRAVTDIEHIAAYTMSQWGPAKMADYLRSLSQRFEWLARNPMAGRERNDVHPGYRGFPEGRHIIFYLVSDNGVDIIGVPHQSMDIGPDIF